MFPFYELCLLLYLFRHYYLWCCYTLLWRVHSWWYAADLCSFTFIVIQTWNKLELSCLYLLHHAVTSIVYMIFPWCFVIFCIPFCSCGADSCTNIIEECQPPEKALDQSLWTLISKWAVVGLAALNIVREVPYFRDFHPWNLSFDNVHVHVPGICVFVCYRSCFNSSVADSTISGSKIAWSGSRTCPAFSSFTTSHSVSRTTLASERFE